MFPTPAAHDAMGTGAVARIWIEQNLSRLPTEAVPWPDEVEPLANMFASYLTTSFDVVDDPRYQLESSNGCFCELCAHLVQAPHLMPKRVTGGDKAHAQRLKVAALAELASDGGRALGRAEALELLARSHISRSAAFVAYAKQLVCRQSGDPGDPAVLALWRELAWSNGAPKRGFVLEVDAVVAAQQALTMVLRVR